MPTQKDKTRALKLGLADAIEGYEPLTERQFAKWWSDREGISFAKARSLFPVYRLGYKDGSTSSMRENASYSSDKEVRDKANKLWDKIVKLVKTQAKKNYPDLFRDPFMDSGGFLLPSSALKLPGDLNIVLAPSGEDSQLKKVDKHYAIYVAGPMSEAEEIDDLDFNITDPRFRVEFVHEYTHYLDMKRRKGGTVPWGKAAEAASKGDYSSYVQTDEEFNALFQETAQVIEHVVTDTEKTARRLMKRGKHGKEEAEDKIEDLKDAFSSFADFQDWVREVYIRAEDIEDFIAGSKWEKKWDKRLYTLYEGLRPIVLTIEL